MDSVGTIKKILRPPYKSWNIQLLNAGWFLFLRSVSTLSGNLNLSYKFKTIEVTTTGGETSYDISQKRHSRTQRDCSMFICIHQYCDLLFIICLEIGLSNGKWNVFSGKMLIHSRRQKIKQCFILKKYSYFFKFRGARGNKWYPVKVFCVSPWQTEIQVFPSTNPYWHFVYLWTIFGIWNHCTRRRNTPKTGAKVMNTLRKAEL